MSDRRPPRMAADLGRALKALHNGPVFGVAGSGNFEMLSTYREAGGEYVAACHEGGAVTMADGWAQVSGMTGVASVHQGPGLTNALTALCDSAKGRTPLLLLAADIPEPGSHSHQYINQAATLYALGVGVIVENLLTPGAAVQALQYAYSRAARERRTVVLNMSVDALASRAEHGVLPQAKESASIRVDSPVHVDVQRVRELIEASHRPLILAGRGAVLSGSGEVLVELAELIGAPLVTTAPARGLFFGHPSSLGIAGGFASSLTTQYLCQSDLILAFGSSLDAWTTANGRLTSHATVVQIDIEPDATAPHAIQGDARTAALRLVEAFGQVGSTRKSDHAARAQADLAGFSQVDQIPFHTDDGGGIDPRRLLARLNALLPENRTVALDSGHFIAMAAMYVDIDRAGGSLFGQAFQSVGLGISRAVGAAFARQPDIVTAIVGDGGFMMSCQELDTAVRHQLPLLTVVINDDGYGAEVHDFAPLGLDTAIARFPPRDIAAIAEGIGAHSRRIRKLDDLDSIADWLENPEGPLVLDCRVDPRISAVSVMTEEGRAEWALNLDQ